ncbi:hypothetical protein E2C01_024246 [Portunus trituberculatus]|uniref:C2H2-type domain-containing protein n=1 Tax=Portunus trituberculatus TaxID=210409 RepID=A0A5B7EE26_PORTR|nr:hypothetical protein [Portunus trituberculatus]
MRDVHTEARRTFTCTLCNKVYASQNSYRVHMSMKHRHQTPPQPQQEEEPQADRRRTLRVGRGRRGVSAVWRCGAQPPAPRPPPPARPPAPPRSRPRPTIGRGRGGGEGGPASRRGRVGLAPPSRLYRVAIVYLNNKLLKPECVVCVAPRPATQPCCSLAGDGGVGGLALMYGAGAGRGGAGGGGGGGSSSSSSGGGPWQCEFCLKYYGSNNSLRNHRSVYHRRHSAEGGAGGRPARGSPRVRPLMLPMPARPTLSYGPPIGPQPTSTPATTAAVTTAAAAAAAAAAAHPGLGHHPAPPT